MNLLEDIIAGSTDDAVSTGNLLRKVQVVSHYLNAADVTAWVKSELNGYATLDSLPNYRRDLSTPVMGTWTGYFGTSATQLLSAIGLPEDAAHVLFHVSFFQPIAELEELASLDSDPSQSWDPWQVGQYSQWNKEGKGVWMEEMHLLNARRLITRASIRGLIDTVRNTALEFALDLHTTDASAGTLNGPTVADGPIASTVNHFTTNVFGSGANVALGDNVHQKSKVVANDVDSLIAAIREIGLAEDGVDEFRAAATAPKGQRKAKFGTVLARVRSGALALGSAISVDVAADQIDALIKQFLGQS